MRRPVYSFCSFCAIHVVLPVFVASTTAQASASTTSQAPRTSSMLLATRFTLVVGIVVVAVVGISGLPGAVAVAVAASLLALVPTLSLRMTFLLNVPAFRRREEAAGDFLEETVGDLFCAIAERLKGQNRHCWVPRAGSDSLRLT